MTNQYKFIRVRADTLPNLKQRTEAINNDIRAMGMKKCRMKVIDFVHLLSLKPVYLSADELAKFAKKQAVKI